MKWDENGVSVHSFYRAAIPSDINDGSPTPSGWGVPEAFLSPDSCDPIKYFVNHSAIFGKLNFPSSARRLNLFFRYHILW